MLTCLLSHYHALQHNLGRKSTVVASTGYSGLWQTSQFFKGAHRVSQDCGVLVVICAAKPFKCFSDGLDLNAHAGRGEIGLVVPLP